MLDKLLLFYCCIINVSIHAALGCDCYNVSILNWKQNMKIKYDKDRIIAVLLVLTIVSVSVIALILYHNLSRKLAYTQTEQASESAFSSQVSATSLADPVPEYEEASGLCANNLDWQKLEAEYPDIIGWIRFDAIDLSMPLVQAGDNEYYLNHAPDKSDDPYGSIFMDHRNAGDFTDDNTVIYGHSTLDHEMFSDLSLFTDQDFFDRNKQFWIVTPDANYRCDIVACIKDAEKTSLAYERNMDGSLKEKYNAALKHSALYSDPDWGGEDTKFVTLSTCDIETGLDTENRIIIRAVIQKSDTLPDGVNP